jgi:hypothetical protein
MEQIYINHIIKTERKYCFLNDYLPTDKTVMEYSNILAANPINYFKDDIKNQEKLLLLRFYAVKKYFQSGHLHIVQKLHIIRTVKDGPVFSPKSQHVYIDSIEVEPNHTKMTKRIDSTKYITHNGNITQRPLYVEYCDLHKGQFYVTYTVRLHSDDLLRDIATKTVQVPSLVHLCFSAIPTGDLKYYNDMNRRPFTPMNTEPDTRRVSCL